MTLKISEFDDSAADDLLRDPANTEVFSVVVLGLLDLPKRALVECSEDTASLSRAAHLRLKLLLAVFL
ncbi:hypothetical protein CKAH01_00787 [Colletotrichum kahawae]|uniref:Uncharacterized protein n=1 Tax=Colletotrichum kahawae TaxID=34407 RepID=A0AAE0DB56_COLKA|nr:hypothetical protein CKAH01_00787 [Colletotrichum kahawae]